MTLCSDGFSFVSASSSVTRSVCHSAWIIRGEDEVVGHLGSAHLEHNHVVGVPA
jgi:hypothetical protein